MNKLCLKYFDIFLLLLEQKHLINLFIYRFINTNKKGKNGGKNKQGVNSVLNYDIYIFFCLFLFFTSPDLIVLKMTPKNKQKSSGFLGHAGIVGQFWLMVL